MRTKSLVIITMVLILVSTINSQQIVYSEDFETDPNYTSLAPEYAYWDLANGNYFVNTFDNLNRNYWAYSPEYGPADASLNITIEMDAKCEHADWGTYPGIYLYTQNPDVRNSANRTLSIQFHWDDTRYKKIFIIGKYEDYLTDTYVENNWYHFKIEYNANLHKANILITDVDSGNIFYEASEVDFTLEQFSWLTIGYYNQPDYGNEWSPIRINNVEIYYTNPAAAGLIAYYPFNGNANDESGNGNHGTVYGATLTADRFGNAGSTYSFDGINDYIAVPDDNTLDLTTQLTLSAWITIGSDGVILAKNGYGESPATDENYGLYIGPIPYTVVGSFEDGTGYGAYIRSATTLAPDSWLHIAWTYNGSQNRIFVDGRLDSSRSETHSLNPQNEPISIGVLKRSSVFSDWFTGLIDDIRIYNRALGATEITALYNEGPPLAPTNLTTTPGDGQTPPRRIALASESQEGSATLDDIKPAPRHATLLEPHKAMQMLTAMSGRKESSQGFVSEARHSLLTIKSHTEQAPLELVLSAQVPALEYVSFSHSGSAALAGSGEGGLYLWNLHKGRPEQAFSTLGLGAATEASTPDSRLMVKATGDGTVQVREASSGRLVRTLTGHNGAVEAVAVSPDGWWVLSGGEDGTLRLWELETGRLLITAVVMPDGQWATLTGDGRFDRSEGFVYLQWRKGNKTYTLDQFFNEFYTPGLLGQVYREGLGEVQRSISQVLQAAPPPQVQIVSPAGDGDVDVTADDVINVMVEVSDAGGGVKEVFLYHNGKAVGGTPRGFKRKSTQQEGVTQLNYRVTLLDGENVLWAVAWNLEGISARSEPVALKYEKPMPDRSELYAVIVGLNKYKNKSYSLNYGRTDAATILGTLQSRGNKLFAEQHIWSLYDGKATRKGILKALEAVVKQARPEDVYVMYYAGHGAMAADEETGRPQFYLAPYSVTRLYDEQMLWKSGISAGQLKVLSQRIKARKQVLMLDACESGGALESFQVRGAVQEKALKQLSRAAGTFLLASSQSDQFSTEFAALGHGAFTYVLLAGLAGQADGGGHDGKITMHELSAYISDEVPMLTESYRGEAQYPTVYAMGDDFPLALGGGDADGKVEPALASASETRGAKHDNGGGFPWRVPAVVLVLLATVGYGIWRNVRRRRK